MAAPAVVNPMLTQYLSMFGGGGSPSSVNPFITNPMGTAGPGQSGVSGGGPMATQPSSVGNGWNSVPGWVPPTPQGVNGAVYGMAMPSGLDPGQQAMFNSVGWYNPTGAQEAATYNAGPLGQPGAMPGPIQPSQITGSFATPPISTTPGTTPPPASTGTTQPPGTGVTTMPPYNLPPSYGVGTSPPVSPIGSTGSSPSNTSSMGYGPDQLNPFLAGQGNPINQLPAWQSMVQAQQTQIQENMANLQEQMNESGNMFGSANSQSSADYMAQTTANQNALLGQMTAQAGENAQNRYLQAAGQLSGQDFQSQMQQYGISAQIAQALAGYQNSSTMDMYNQQMSLLPQSLNYNLGLQQLAGSESNNLGGLYNNTMALGGQLGQQQYTDTQSAINNQYQNWLYSQPQNNPFLSYMQQLNTYYPSEVSPGYNPGMLGGLMGGLGGLLGGIGQMGGTFAGLGGLLGI